MAIMRLTVAIIAMQLLCATAIAGNIDIVIHASDKEAVVSVYAGHVKRGWYDSNHSCINIPETIQYISLGSGRDSYTYELDVNFKANGSVLLVRQERPGYHTSLTGILYSEGGRKECPIYYRPVHQWKYSFAGSRFPEWRKSTSDFICMEMIKKTESTPMLGCMIGYIIAINNTGGDAIVAIDGGNSINVHTQGTFRLPIGAHVVEWWTHSDTKRNTIPIAIKPNALYTLEMPILDIIDAKEVPIDPRDTSLNGSELRKSVMGGGGATGEGLAGVVVRGLSPRIRQNQGIALDVDGVVVASVERTSNAWNRGLREGDVILEVGRETVVDISDFEDLVQRDPDRPVLLKIMRGYRAQLLAITR